MCGLGQAALVPVLAATPQPPVAGVAAAAHLQAAQRQARGDAPSMAMFKRQCALSQAPRTAALAVQQLRQAEADHQAERALPRPRADRLLQMVVARGCAAHHATRLQPGLSYPVWWHSQLRFDGIRPAATGFEIQARAHTADGAVATSRITFARGLHHACFVLTDAQGLAACVMVDTHPHGGRPDAWADAHEGPFVATLAGSVSPTRVELPAVEFRDLPVFASAPVWR
ncbi:MAG: hypothetical protein QE285_17705 [Aquabacterium sp.]|nr:hypothetical protein [Aquabacterium sp.]